jgi:diaminopimelate epimerase
MGRAATVSDAYPSGEADGRGTLAAAGRRWSFQHVSIGNPQCAIPVPDAAELAALDLREIGPAIERHELFPQRTNVSWFTEVSAPDGASTDGQASQSTIRARIFERGVGETLASGTGACGAAVAHVLAGRSAPVTVRLDGGELLVELDDQLGVHLTGWAMPVYRGALAEELIEELHETQ